MKKIFVLYINTQLKCSMCYILCSRYTTLYLQMLLFCIMYIYYFLSKQIWTMGLYSVMTLLYITESDNSGRINWKGCRKSAWSSEESSSGLGQDWRPASSSERKELGTCPCKTRNISCRNFAGMLSTLHINFVWKILSAFWKWSMVETEFLMCYTKHLKRLISMRNEIVFGELQDTHYCII